MDNELLRTRRNQFTLDALHLTWAAQAVPDGRTRQYMEEAAAHMRAMVRDIDKATGAYVMPETPEMYRD